MKKGLIIIAIISAISIYAILGIAAAETHLEITRGMKVVGEGVFDSELHIQGSPYGEGLKYYGEAYTPMLGVYGPSKVATSTEYMFTTGNHSELQIAEESAMQNIRSKRCSKNYELGVLQAFNVIGNYTIIAEFGSDYNMSSMAVESQISGKALVEVIVRDLNVTHFYIIKDKSTFKGNYTIAIDSLIQRVEEPRAGFDDWLGCP